MSGISLGFAALLLVLAATAVWSYRAFKVVLPKDLGSFAAAWGVGAVIGVTALFQGTANPGAAITAISLGGLMLFLLKAGRQKPGDHAIAVGDRIPEFSAPDENGEIFESSSLAGSAVVLKVFRGHW